MYIVNIHFFYVTIITNQLNINLNYIIYTLIYILISFYNSDIKLIINDI